MKILFLLTTILFSSISHSEIDDAAFRRSNGLLRFIAEQETLRNTALSMVIGTRCSRYLPAIERGPCKEAVKKMIQILDYDVLFKDEVTPSPAPAQRKWSPSSFVFVAFKQKLLSLLEDPKTKSYLNHLNHELYRFLLNEVSDINIWDITFKHFKNDYSTAMAIAVLFQDTSRLKLHIGYLDQHKPSGTKTYEDNKELLERVIEAVNLVLDNSEEHYRKIFYPEAIQGDLNRNIYHFYVPLFLAKALEREGLKKEAAYVSTLMLTLTYEFVTASGSYRFILKDPESVQDKHTLHDIYGGHCGSMIGVYGPNFQRPFHKVLESFRSSTPEGVELLLKIKQTAEEKLSLR